MDTKFLQYIIYTMCIGFFIHYYLNNNNKIEKYYNLNKKQLLFKKTLEDMANILKENNISFFLMFGTALGAHREKKFIEHDNDIDIGLYSVDFNKIPIILNKIKNIFNLDKIYPENNNPTEYTFIHKNTDIKIDLFNIYCKNNICTSYTYNSICNNKKDKRCIYNYPLNLININFLGNNYIIPDTTFLKNFYGDDWYIPKKFDYFQGLEKNLYKSLIN